MGSSTIELIKISSCDFTRSAAATKEGAIALLGKDCLSFLVYFKD
jgi:hypothetical protein